MCIYLLSWCRLNKQLPRVTWTHVSGLTPLIQLLQTFYILVKIIVQKDIFPRKPLDGTSWW